MAGQYGHQTRPVRLVALLLFCLAAGLTRWAVSSPASSRSNWSTRTRVLAQPNLNPVRIQGRWEAVRASLHLPPPVSTPKSDSALHAGRPDRRASRFDPGRKRRADEAARQLARLHFAHDVAQPTQPGETYA